MKNLKRVLVLLSISTTVLSANADSLRTLIISEWSQGEKYSYGCSKYDEKSDLNDSQKVELRQLAEAKGYNLSLRGINQYLAGAEKMKAYIDENPNRSNSTKNLGDAIVVSLSELAYDSKSSLSWVGVLGAHKTTKAKVVPQFPIRAVEKDACFYEVLPKINLYLTKLGSKIYQPKAVNERLKHMATDPSQDVIFSNYEEYDTNRVLEDVQTEDRYERIRAIINFLTDSQESKPVLKH